MITFLPCARTQRTFEARMQTHAVNTQKNAKSAMRNFELFCQAKYGRGTDLIIEEYRKVDIDTVYGSLQEWINWNDGRGLHPNSMPTLFSYVKKYLRYHKIHISKDDVAEQLAFPHAIKEEKHPLTKNELQRILLVSNKNNTLKILAQVSSGLRRGELLQLRKKDLDTTRQRIAVNVPASITKTKKSRVTFFSSEVCRMLLPKLRGMGMDDRVFFRGNATSPNISNHYQIILAKYLKRAGLDQKYESGRNKITSHSFRAYFITRVSRHDPNLAKYFAGQEQSSDLLVYDRLTLEEKLAKYVEFEKDLLILG